MTDVAETIAEMTEQTERAVHDAYGNEAYGKEVDLALLALVEARNAVGLPVDDSILRSMLCGLLELHGKTNLLTVNGGSHTFGNGWRDRFFKRHNLSARKATRSNQSDRGLEEKRLKFTRITAKVIAERYIPPELVVNADETAVLCASTASHTICKRGSKRVRVIGIGASMEQHTCTLAVSEAGQVLFRHDGKGPVPCFSATERTIVRTLSLSVAERYKIPCFSATEKTIVRTSMKVRTKIVFLDPKLESAGKKLTENYVKLGFLLEISVPPL
jgi:hypothetical protein